jgi:hypothetical protein
MDRPVAEPRLNPMPSNMVDAEAFEKILQVRQVPEGQSVLPLGEAGSIQRLWYTRTISPCDGRTTAEVYGAEGNR